MAADGGRILFVTSNFPRWAGDSTTPFVLELAQDLSSRGWQVDVLAPHAPGAAARELLDGIAVTRFKYLWPSSLETLCYQGGALINLRRNKWNYLKIPFFVVAEIISLAKAVRSGRYDIIHAHWILPQGFAGIVVAGIMRKPHVLTVHGSDVFALQAGILRWFKKLVLNRVDRVTVNSSASRQAVLGISGRAKELSLIPMGVNVAAAEKSAPEVFRLREKYLGGRKALVIFVGRLVEEKGVQDFIDALRMLDPESSGIRGLIVGDGPERAALEKEVSDAGLSVSITFTGWIDHESIYEHLAAADIFIGPSRVSKDGSTEAQGLTFLEAMSVGTPVIATRVGGIVDFVTHDETGILVNERSPHEIAAAVSRLLNDRDLYDHVCVQARSMVVRDYSRQATAAAFTELFEGLLV